MMRFLFVNFFVGFIYCVKCFLNVDLNVYIISFLRQGVFISILQMRKQFQGSIGISIVNEWQNWNSNLSLFYELLSTIVFFQFFLKYIQRIYIYFQCNIFERVFGLGFLVCWIYQRDQGMIRNRGYYILTLISKVRILIFCVQDYILVYWVFCCQSCVWFYVNLWILGYYVVMLIYILGSQKICVLVFLLVCWYLGFYVRIILIDCLYWGIYMGFV